MQTILIAGCGYLGTTVGALLARLGYPVRGLRRNPAGLPDSIEPVRGDLTDPGLELAPADWLVFAAAPSSRGEAGYRAIYVDGLARVLDALERAGALPSRALFVSSTAVYGQDGGEWVDEDSPTVPADYRGATLLEAEAHLRARVDTPISLRLGGLYGPGRTRLIESVLNGESDFRAEPPNYTNRIHRDDAALATVHLLEAEGPAPIYCGVDDGPAPRGEVLSWLANRLDAPRPRHVAQPVLGRGGNKRVSNARLRAAGYRFKYPTFREGYEQVIAAEGPSLWNREEAE
ncbi:SDR family oxidoreductase [Engelhardtia mirabilis]|uniref:NAD dependent epimerase/dehydratase family protein n=1 Tax=Engelhardtia mirabilis TaxID=2528011 RepID=A0A518BHX1_9BACT|nr:NAD dependent epimerase/dehydratase family protein [Planctomycetes bacterium Pla133]QDV00905.1 NAD dependent epimerase/dehydratase family protein [Planctomycetes bacterium Pla86]